MNLLSALFWIIMDHGINAPGNGKNVVDGINSTNFVLKENTELVGN